MNKNVSLTGTEALRWLKKVLGELLKKIDIRLQTLCEAGFLRLWRYQPIRTRWRCNESAFRLD